MTPAPTNAKAFTRLLNEGPIPANEIDASITPEQRRDGVSKFHAKNNTPSGGVKGGGPMTKVPVYYIRGKHSPKTVVETWIDANKETLEAVGKRAIHWRISSYGKEWKEASREILGPFPSWGTETSGKPDMESCPMCESKIGKSLASHLPECPEA